MLLISIAIIFESKGEAIFKQKRSVHDYLTIYNSTDLAEFLFKNRNEIGEVLVDFGAVEHLS